MKNKNEPVIEITDPITLFFDRIEFPDKPKHTVSNRPRPEAKTRPALRTVPGITS